MPGTDSKPCTKCGEAKPLSEFGPHPNTRDRLHTWCKPCRRARRNQWYDENRAANLAYQAAWRTKNKARKSASDKAWREANPERKAANDAAYRLANRDSREESIRAWRKANPERVTEIRRRRRARKSGALVSRVYFQTVLIRDCGICGICNQPIMDDTIELDHVTPLAAGGTHEPDNVQIAHRTCNRRKSAKTDFALPAA